MKNNYLNIIIRFAFFSQLFCFIAFSQVQAQTQTQMQSQARVDLESGGFLAEIKINSPGEVKRALERAELLFEQGAVNSESGPATLVLYGSEVSIFLKENYQQNKEIVDLAARLSAFNVVEIKVCELHLGTTGHDMDAMHPFVGKVPYGPGEVNRLIKEEKYSYF